MMAWPVAAVVVAVNVAGSRASGGFGVTASVTVGRATSTTVTVLAVDALARVAAGGRVSGG